VTSGGMSVLPSPSHLLASSVTQGLLDDDTSALVSGSKFNTQLPYHRVGSLSLKASFKPQYPLEQGSTNKDPAYACYRITVPDYTHSFPKVHFRWLIHALDDPSDDGPSYAGLANLSTDRWDWFLIPNNGAIELNSIQPYFNSYGEIVVAVVALGTLEEQLTWMVVGKNYPPDGYLSASQGDAPLSVELTASCRDTDGTIVSSAWDFDSDGVIDKTGAFSVTHTYPAPGTYDVTFTAIDNNGETAEFHLPVVASRWTITLVPAEVHEAWSADMVLDPAGQIHLAASNSQGGLMYYLYADSVWVTETISSNSDSYRHIVLAVDVSGEPHILASRYDSQQGAYSSIFAERQGGVWQSGQLGWNAQQSEAAYDAQNRLHAAWVTIDSGTEEQYGMRAGGTWQFIRLHISADSGALVIGSDNSISVVLGWVPFDFGMDAGASALLHDRDGWQNDQLFNTSSTVLALELDPLGRPVVCVDNSDNGLCIETLSN
jgi:hypothetical protein